MRAGRRLGIKASGKSFTAGLTEGSITPALRRSSCLHSGSAALPSGATSLPASWSAVASVAGTLGASPFVAPGTAGTRCSAPGSKRGGGDAGCDGTGLPGGRRLRAAEPGQAQAVGHDRHGGEAHGGAGDDRVEEAGHGQGDGGGVVAEGPAQVLEDGAEGPPGQADGGGDPGEVGGQQGDVGGLDGDVGAGADGDAEVGLDQGGGVVDAVADHGHHPALLLEAADGGDLVGGEDLGEDVADTDLAAMAAAVAWLSPVIITTSMPIEARSATAAGASALRVSATASTPRTSPSQPAKMAVLPSLSSRWARSSRAGGMASSVSAMSLRRPTWTTTPSRVASTPWPATDGNRWRRGGQAPVAGAVHHRPAHRVLGGVLDRCRPAEEVARVDAVGGFDVGEGHLAPGERAGLVEDDRVDALGALEDLAALDEDAHGRAPARAHHDGRGRGQPEGAGAGDDQDRHGGDQAGVGVAGQQPPTQEGAQGDQGDDGDEDPRDAVGEALDRGLGALGLLDQADDLGQGGVAARRRWPAA